MAPALFLAWLDAVPTEMDRLVLTPEQTVAKQERFDRVDEALQEARRRDTAAEGGS